MSLVSQKTAIKTLLEAVEVDSTAVFNQVKTAPPKSASEFTGYPSAYFVYNNYESDYSTNEENRRQANWTIYIYSYTQNLSREAHFDKIYAIIDATVQKLDENDDLSRTCDFLVPVPGQIDLVEADGGEGLLAEINLRCWTDVDVRV